MRHLFYGKKMQVADLAITSVWALFAAKATPGLELWGIAVILMRIVLCFQLAGRSRWAGYSAIIFGLGYFMTPNHLAFGFRYTPVDMICYALHIADWNMAEEFYLHPDDTGFQTTIYLIWGLLTLWLVAMPIIILSIKKIIFKFPKWCWLNIVPFAILVLCGPASESGNPILTLWIVVSCCLPQLYWIIVNGRKESLAGTLYQNKPLVYYCAFAALMLGSLILGLRNLYILRAIGFFCIPAVFYALSCACAGLRKIPTYDTIVMGISGGIYWMCMEAGKTGKIIGYAVATAMILVVAFRLSRLTSSKITGPGLAIVSVFIIYPALCGMNPYTVLDASHLRLYMKKPGAYHGLYVTDAGDRKYGLRDRYGEILPMKYHTIDILDSDHDQSILCCLERISDNGGEYDEYYSFFDLSTRQFIGIPDDIPIRGVEMVRSGVYALYDESESPAFYLVLPWCVSPDDNDYYGNEIRLIDNRHASSYAPDDIEFPEDAIILSSSDGKIKFISWDTGMGGSSPDYASYIQYLDNDTLKTDFFSPHSQGKYVCAGDLRKKGYMVYDDSYTDGLWQVDAEGESPVYIVSTYDRASFTEGYQTIYALQFDPQGKLVKKRFLDKYGELSDRISIGYNIPACYFTTDGLCWDWMVSMDENTQNLYSAVSCDDMTMNDRYDVYHYEHGRMAYKFTDGGYWLHPSLREFDNLCGIYNGKDGLYRVDKAGNSYRLSMWGKNKSMKDEPDLIIHNGQAAENHIDFTAGSKTITVPLYRRGLGNDYGKIVIIVKSK